MEFDASTAQPVAGANDFDASTATPYKPSGVIRRLADTALSVGKGVIGVPEAAVGVADLVTGGRAGLIAERAGYRPKVAKDMLTELMSPEAKAASAEVAAADGFIPTLGAMVKNPSTIVNSVAESAPSMLGGGVVSRGAIALAPKLSPVIAGALGEGVMAAGQNAEQVRQEDPNGTLTSGQSAILAGSGAATGLISGLSGKLANKLGIGDVNTMLAAGRTGVVGADAAAAGAKKGIIRKIAEGVATEGALQELPQSAQEQAAQNIAQGKPWDEGVGAAAAQGLLVGGVTGGVAAPFGGEKPVGPISRAAAQLEGKAPPPAAAPPRLLSAPIISVDPEGNAKTAGQRQSERPAQVRGNIVEKGAKTNSDVTDVEDKLAGTKEPAGQTGQAQSAIENVAERPPKQTGEFTSEEDARGYITSQKRAGGTDISALPLPMPDGTFSVAIKGSPDYTIAEFHQNQQRLRKLGVQDGDVLKKDGEIFKHQLPARQAARKAGADHDVVPVTGGFVVRKKTAGATDGNTTDVRGVDPAAAGSGVSDTGTSPSAGARPDGQPGPTVGTGDAAAEPAGGAVPRAAAQPDAVKTPEQAYRAELDRIQADYEAHPNVMQRDSAKAKAKKRYEKALFDASKAPPDQKGRAGTAIKSVATETAPPAGPPVTQEGLFDKPDGAAVTQKAPAVTSSDGLVKIKTVQGTNTHVRQADLDGDASLLPMFTADGKKNGRIHRENLDPTGEKQAAANKEDAANPLFDVVTAKQGETFANAMVATREMRKRGLMDSHEVVPASEVNADAKGFIVRKKSATADLDAAAHAAATSPKNDLPEPTEAQKEAGNYKKGHITVQGLDITVENPKGSDRSGTAPDGTTWSHTMSDHYGYIKRTVGADNEQVDVYVGPQPDSERVFVVDQLDQKTGNFDEHKVMLGFKAQPQAVKAYKSNFDKGWKVGPVKSMTMDEFKAWLKEGDTSKPAADAVPAVTNDRANLLIMGVRDREGEKLGDIIEKHDGTPEGIVAAGQRAQQRADDEFAGDASGIHSLMGATDADGKPAWSVFPQAQPQNQVLPIDSKLARGMWGDTSAMFDEFVAQRGKEAPAETKALPTGTAPEHVQTGVDERELGQIVKEFNEAQDSMVNGDDKVTHVFDPPAKGDIVRLADKVKVYQKEKGWMTVAQAKEEIAKWKEQAKAQGENAAENGNAHRVVLSLFDLTGSWSKPWEEAGYTVVRFDIQADPDMGDVTKFSTEFFTENFGDFDGKDVYAILAACPCTDFAVSGARHFAAKDADGRTVASVKLVHQALATIEYFKPAVWSLENPVGRIEKLGGLPPWRLSFDPNHLGDPYTKKTLLWGRFNGQLPIAPVEPTEGSKMHKLYGGKSQATKNARSETPEGFSYGFFLANNAVDHPAMAIAHKFDRLDPKLIAEAVEAGVTEQQISDAVDDFYYMDLDDAAANDAIRALIKPEPTPSKELAEPKNASIPEERSTTSAKPGKIDDAGEVLEGARKLYAKAYNAKLDEAMGMEIASLPLSKSWPEPDYQRMLDEGTEPWNVAFVRAARDEIPTKPSTSWKVEGWAKKVAILRDFAHALLNGDRTREEITRAAVAFRLEKWFNKVELYDAVGHEHSLKGISFQQHEFNMYGGVKYDTPKTLWVVNQQSTKASAGYRGGSWGIDVATGDTKAEAIEKFKEYLAKQEPEKSLAKPMTFDIYTYRGKPGVIVGKRTTASSSIDLKTFDSVKEAREYRAAHQEELVKMLEAAKYIPPERRAENSPRVGIDHRNGADITNEQFREVFGFRGEQFGASMPQIERQSNLNQTYDALMDLAGVIGVPPRALSLNGELGMAFGSRGRGGKRPAAAHYEGDTTGEVTPNRVVINLTRKNGAGSLAHEWFHAVDNYFARQRGQKGGFVTDTPHASVQGKMRTEMVNAFAGVMSAIKRTAVFQRSKTLDAKRSKDYWSTGLEMAARSFESYVIAKLHDQNASNDYLANIVSESAFGVENGYPYPTAGELPQIRAAYDHFFDTLETQATENGNVALMAKDIDLAAFKRFFGAAKGMPIEEAQAIVNRLTASWKNGPRIVVLNNPGQAPVKINPNSRGLYYGDKGSKTVYVFAENNLSADAVARTVAHEAIAHYGLRDMLGGLGHLQFMNQINAGIARGDKHLVAARDYVKTAYAGQNLSAKDMADEVAAKVVEMAVDPETGEFKPGFELVKKILARIAEFLRKLGLNIPFTLAELHGVLVQSMENLQTGQRSAGGGQLVVAAARSDNPVSVPPVIIGNTLGSATAHPDYVAAKAGDTLAAVKVAKSLVNDELVDKVKAALAGAKPMVVPVVSEEATGRNQIPMASATVLANRLGLERVTGIVQANRPHRTKLDGMDRIFAGPDFVGEVVPGGKYLLVDDTLTQGATFAALASHISDNGGTVVGAVAMTGKQYSATLQPQPDTLRKLREKHGDIESDFRAATGYGFDALTQSEARYLASFEPAQSVRDRIAAEAQRRLSSGNRPDSGDRLAALDQHADGRLAEQLLADTDSSEVSISLEDYAPGEVELVNLEAARKGRGAGSKAMHSLASAADRQGINLMLIPAGEGVRRQRLIDFYERFGFQEDGDVMRRRAAPIQKDDAPNQTGTQQFKKWFGDSKVVDADGKPLVVYHGTDAKFTEFDLEKQGEGEFGAGFYFGVDKSFAKEFGPNVMPVYLSIKNPMRPGSMSEEAWQEWRELKETDPAGAREVAIDDGFDGIDAGGEWVAFHPEQIKSAVGNKGDFDGSQADILMALDDPKAEARLSAMFKATTVTDVKRKTGNKFADYRGLGLSFLGGRQINDLYSELIPQLPKYTAMVQQMSADANEVGANADEVATTWGKLPDERELAELMHDATLAQIDPAKPFVVGDNRIKWGQLNAQFNALSNEAKKVYTDARDGYEDHYAQVRDAIREKIQRSDMSQPAKAKLLERMDGEFFEKIKGVYFPLSRFGKYVVVTRNISGEVVNVSRAETLNEAENVQNELRLSFPAAKGYQVGKVLKDKEFNAARDAVGRGFLKELFGMLDEKGVGEELQDAVNQLYLASMPDLSWAKHGIHRKGTPGYSQDARRAYAQNMFHGARYLAKLRYADQLQEGLVQMQKHVEAQVNNDDFDSVKGQQVVDEITKRNDSLMNPKSNPLSTALTSFGFVFHLGLSPASAMVNLSQTALVAYPIMGAKWGFDKAAAALAVAGKQAATNKNDISSALNPDERRAYDAAVNAGTIDVTNAHDLAGIAQGEDSKVSWKLRPVMKWASFLFHHAERFNRQVTFVAAYRLAREAGAAHDVAYDQATKATYDGHFDYASSNRPRVMQGNVAKVVLLFKQFGQNMIYTIARQAQQAIKAETPEGRAEARKALGGLLTMHAAGAGVLGLPMVSVLLAAASMLGSSDDEPWDAETALRNMLADAFGQKPAEVMARGLSRLTPWDISGRVGLDKLILPDVQEGLEGQRLAESAMAAALGPVAGIGINALKGMNDIAAGRYQLGLEGMLPAALRGPVKAIRYAEDGAKDRTGVVIKDEVGAAGIAGQALGFSPSEVRNATEGRSAVFQADQQLVQRRKELMDGFAQATMKKDAEGVAAARAEILEFNLKNPSRQIRALNLMQSVRNRQKRIDEAQDGIFLPKNRRDAMAAGQFAKTD